MNRFIRPLLLVAIVATLVSAPVGCVIIPKSESPNAPDLYEHVRLASVEVLIDGRLQGSGWFATPDGYIVTAAHVVVGHTDGIEVITGSGARIDVTLAAMDLGHDIALLKAPATDAADGYAFLRVAEKMPGVASDVYLFGAPQFRHAVFVRGSIARAEPEYEYYGDNRFYVRMYHVSAPSPHGTSGGCWVDTRGRVIGNQSGLMLNNGAGNGLAFVAPTDAVRRLVTTKQSAATPSMDGAFEELWEQGTDTIKKFPKGAEGVIVAVTHDGGPLKAAGLNRNTLITAIDGQKVRYRKDLLDAVRSHAVGDTVTLTVLDAEKPEARQVPIKLISLEGR